MRLHNTTEIKIPPTAPEGENVFSVPPGALVELGPGSVVSLAKEHRFYSVAKHYRKVQVFHVGVNMELRHVDSVRPPKGLKLAERKKIIEQELKKYGFVL